MVLPVEPDLRADGPVRDPGDEDRHLAVGRGPKDARLVSCAGIASPMARQSSWVESDLRPAAQRRARIVRIFRSMIAP